MAEISPISQRKAREFGKDYTKILVRELLRAGKNATGQLIRSINYKLKEDAENLLIEIEAENYLEFVDKGRRRGTYPPIKPLIEWTQVKGLPENAAWGIQKNIYKFGIKPTNVIQKVINEFENSPTLKKKYEDEVVNNLIKMINNKYTEI
jgi:hypothetical protein